MTHSPSLIHRLDDALMISKIYGSRKMAAMLALSISAGLPIMLVYTVLSGWLREAGVSRTAIGFFVLVGFAYSLKMLWAPLVDRFAVPGFSKWLGNRRGWTLLAILGTAASMFAMGLQDPGTDLAGLALCAVLLAFSSATLDICVDAWRIDSAKSEEQASMSAVYQLGYRLGMILAVSGGLGIADAFGFQATYWVLGIVVLIGSTTLLWASEPEWVLEGYEPPRYSKLEILGFAVKGLTFFAAIAAVLYFGLKEGGFMRIIGAEIKDGFNFVFNLLPSQYHKATKIGAFVFILLLPFLTAIYFLSLGRRALEKSEVYAIPILGDFADVVRRLGWMSLVVLGIIATYRISDTTMGVMAMPLYIDLGFEKDTIGIVKGLFGVSVLIVGAFLGGWSALRYGLAKTMIYGAVLTIVTNLAFAWLAGVDMRPPLAELYYIGAYREPHPLYLFVTIGADNLAAGFAGSVFIAFMSILTNKKFTASQYALFSSLFAFYGKSLASQSGRIADAVEYQWFFIITALFGVPALILAIHTWMSGFTERMVENNDMSGNSDKGSE